MFKKRVIALPIFLVFLLSFAGLAFAQTDILSLHTASDKASYQTNEEVQIGVQLEHLSEFYQVNNVTVTSVFPEPFALVSDDVNHDGNKVVWDIESIRDGETVDLDYTIKLVEEAEPEPPAESEDPEDSEGPENDDGTSITIEEDDNGGAATDEDSLKAPQTGDETSFALYYTILFISLALGLVAIGTLVIIRKKSLPKGITFILIAVLFIPAVSHVHADSAEDEAEIVSLTHELTIEVDGETYTVVTTVSGEVEQTAIPEEDVEGITVDPEEITLAPGNTGQFVVSATDGTITLPLPQDAEALTYTLSEEGIIALEAEADHVNVTALDEASDGDTVEVAIEYIAGGAVHTADVTVNVVIAKGILNGQVLDASDDTPIEGATVYVYDGNTVIEEIVTDADGNYETEINVGTYTVQGTHEAYLPDEEVVDIEEGEVATQDVVLKLIPDDDEPGLASGFITDALTGEAIEDVTIEVRPGKGNTEGDIAETTTTNEEGRYSLEFPAGHYTIVVSKDGYVSNTRDIVVIGGEERDNQNATITSQMEETDFRIVLTWGETPRDLDSHVTGPAHDYWQERFHVFYGYTSYEDEFSDVNLDVDEMSGFGPETVTITKMRQDETYVYAVHDYTNSFEETSDEMSYSGAKVEVYKGNSKIETFNIPTDNVGNVWTVFEIKNGNIIPVNTFKTIEFSEHSSHESYLPSN